MSEKDEECYYSCFGCGTIMKQEGDLLTCPVCGHTVAVNDYYNEIENLQKHFNEMDEEEEESDILDVNFNEFYSY